VRRKADIFQSLAKVLDKAGRALDYFGLDMRGHRPRAGSREKGLRAMRRTVGVMVVSGVLAALLSFSAAQASQLRSGLAAFARRDYVHAASLLVQPAQAGNAEAQAAMCFLHTYGRGVPQSFPAAAYWCHRAAEQGSPQGQYMLGLLYSKGHGVPENYVLAYKWLNLAASRAVGPKQDFSFRIRDAVASKMSPHQVAVGQAMSLAWQPLPERPLTVVPAR
jgi:hypothetical protein